MEDSYAGATRAGGAGGRPAVSVVVPVHNGSGTLRACLGALRQSVFQGFELIVVDDGSRDDSAAVAKAFGARVIRFEERRGPASARNRGVEAARGQIVCFLDADVCVHRDAIGRMVETFACDASIDAVFGSYDCRPAALNFLSQYKNLFHHFVHQHASREASTFWAGCGAVRRASFLAVGGFDSHYRRPCIEDIELGARLRRRGCRIALRREIQATHLKRWDLRTIVRSDVLDRALPWTELILRDGALPNDLNLKVSQRVSATLACGLAGLLLLGEPAAAGALLLALLMMNWRLYAFFIQERGAWFAARVVPLHVLYYLYSTAAFAFVWLRRALRTAPSQARATVSPRRVLRHARAVLQTGRTVL